MQAVTQKERERQREYARKYYKRHRLELLEYKRQWYKNNREAIHARREARKLAVRTNPQK